jgi:hypothetical protein
MMRGVAVPFLAGAIVTLVGCAGADPDVSRSRAISEDIDAVYDTGPTSLYPGKNPRDEPDGAYPWRID